jgi:hypothetical protein
MKKTKAKKRKVIIKKKTVTRKRRSERKARPIESGVRMVVGVGLTKAAIKHLGL